MSAVKDLIGTRSPEPLSLKRNADLWQHLSNHRMLGAFAERWRLRIQIKSCECGAAVACCVQDGIRASIGVVPPSRTWIVQEAVDLLASALPRPVVAVDLVALSAT